MDMIEVKVRKVGTSLGVLIPQENVTKNKLKEGSKVKIVVIKKNLKLIEEIFGSAKGKPFKREHLDRVI